AELAVKLRAEPGDVLTIEITEGRRPDEEQPIDRVNNSYIGSGGQMCIEVLNRMLRAGPLVSGAFLAVDESKGPALFRRLKEAPSVAGVSLQSLAAEQLAQMLDENIGLAVGVYILFAALIALGVVYNTVRISF